MDDNANRAALFNRLMTVAKRCFRRSQLKQFEFVIHRHQGEHALLVYKADGYGNEWKQHSDVSLSGFNSDSIVDLRSDWNYVIKNQLTEYEKTITTYETIRKFGEALQLKAEYTIFFRAEYTE